MTALSDEIDAMIAEHGGRVRDALNIAMAQRDALRAELADVRAQWQADVGSAIARAQTEEADARRWQAEAHRMMDLMMGEHMRSLKQSAAARKVAQAYRELDAENSRWIGIVSGVLHERDAARAEAARLRADLTEVVYLLVEARRMGFIIATAETVGWASRVDAHLAALRGPAQSEQPAAPEGGER